MVVGKLVFVVVFLLFTSPTSAHALARAAFTHGLKPILDSQSFDETLILGELDHDPPGKEEQDAS
jgi:multicomponent Na+:H+ antiporter subunit G